MTLRLLRLLLPLALLHAAAGAANLDEALAAKRAGDYPRAIALFRELTDTSPDNVAYLFHLGTVQGWSGDYDAARATFERALKLAPHDADLRLGYGRVLAWSGKLAPAESIFRAILADHPGNLEALNMLARILAWQRQFDAAGAIYADILARAPENTDALIGAGDLEQQQERHDAARAFYQRALAIEPDSADLRRRLAAVRRTGRWRLDAGVEFSTFSGDTREDWRGYDAALRYSLDRRTGIALSTEHARRFGLTDIQYGFAADRRFTDRLNAAIRLTATPSADFFARRALAASATTRLREATEHSGATWLAADYRAADFGIGTAHSLWLGVTQHFENRLALTAKALLSRNLNDESTSGWQLRLDGEPTDHWRWYLGYADTYESLSSTVFDLSRELRTRTVFGGVHRQFSPVLGLRLDVAHERTATLPERLVLHAGITTRF